VSARTPPDEVWRRSRRQAAAAARARRRRAGVAVVATAIAVIAAVLLAESGGDPARHPMTPPNRSAATDPAARTARPRQARADTARRHAPGTAEVPILMYHVIAPPLATAAYPGLYVPPAEFAAQMQALDRAGYHAVTLDQVRSSWLRGTPLPAKPIVLSFDNGYRTQFTQALPVLERYHWVGDENLQLSGLPPAQGGLSTREVRLLVKAGWELDTQGFSHADLPSLDAAQLHYQVAVARSVLRQRYHVPVDWFCYPSGLYDSTVIAAVRAAGFVGSTTVIPGWAGPHDDPYRLPRLRVLGGTSPQELLALIAGTRASGAAPSSYLGG
jgi:peptidoglycan/xylan/chitin deacetylase (PgdA/CDA1 family)